MTGADIGQQLQQARQAQKITIEQAAQATHMRAHYLRALEAGDLAALPSAAQMRGFLRAYASYLKLDSDALLAELDRGEGAISVLGAEAITSAGVEDTTRPGGPLQQENRSELAEAIFIQIGVDLRQRRELLGLSLDDVERHTHLRRRNLQALEDGDLDALPSPVQGRGMLDNYASFLGMDPEPLLLRFAEGLQARLAVKQKATVEPGTQPLQRASSMPLPLQRLISPDVLIGVTFLIFLAAFLLWGAIRIFSMRTVELSTATAPSIADVLLATETGTTAPTAIPSGPTQQAAAPVSQDAGTTTPTLEFILPTGGAPGVQVYVTVLQRAWARVLVDGKIEFEGRVLPGSAYPFVGETQVEILTSNGAALRIFYNQQDLGLMGAYGQIVDLIFTTQAVVSPTPAPTRTPEPTPRPSPTTFAPISPGETASP